MTKNGINLNAAFINYKKSSDIQNAYRLLKSHTKFRNYSDNATRWADGFKIRYNLESFDYFGMFSDDACRDANDLIRQMINEGYRMEQQNG